MKLSTQFLLAFSVVLVLSVIDTTSNYLLSLKVEKNVEFLNKSQEIMRNSVKLHKTIIEMQSSFRGYLLTQDTNLLNVYNIGLKSLPILYTEEEILIKENREQSSLLDSIIFIHQQWTNYAKEHIKLQGIIRKPLNTNDLLVGGDFNKITDEKLNDSIRQKFLAFDKLEYKTRSLHKDNLISSIKRTHIFSLTFFGLTIIFGIASTIYIVRLISKRIKTMTQLAENISKGNFTTITDINNDEMTSLSTSLNIMSDKLSKNIKELEKQNGELDKFSYVVSHDLKAPLRGIHNVIKWIEEDLGNELSPQLKKYLDIIPERTKRMEDLINGLLAFARTREKTIPEKTAVAELLREIVKIIVPRNFKVEIKEMPIIITERLKLEQVFTNLISNAVKYAKVDNGEIILKCTQTDNSYEFSVKDNGIGIEEEYHTKIFEMFQTLREKDEKESTGIGLAIIKKILDDLHCTIWINSTLGNGTEFIFTWPLK